MINTVGIPMDVYESPREIVIIVPLGGVEKKSVELYFDDFNLVIKGNRVQPALKSDLILQQDECYWGEFTQNISLPPYVYFDRIHSEITSENILIVTVPKSLHPGEKVKLDVTIRKPQATKGESQSIKKVEQAPTKITTRGRPKKTDK